jgi:uncharacterized glyoxalase superfamily protein PhnB
VGALSFRNHVAHSHFSFYDLAFLCSNSRIGKKKSKQNEKNEMLYFKFSEYLKISILFSDVRRWFIHVTKNGAYILVPWFNN